MLDLVSIDEIKPIKDGIRCRTCLKFNVIQHASDVWQIEDDKFVRITLPVVTSCFLTDKICKGSVLRDEDYETIEACEAYEESGAWDGINKTFITVIQGLIDYIILTENLECDKMTIMGIAKNLEKTTVAMPLEEGKGHKDIREQFAVERTNYDLMEAVRSRVHDT